MAVPTSEEFAAIALDAGGSRILAGTRDGTLKIWDTKTGQVIGEPQAAEGAGVVAFSPDDTRFVSGGPGGARLWNALTLQPVGEPLVHTGRVTAAAFSPDATLLGSDKGTLVIWDAKTGDSDFRHPSDLTVGSDALASRIVFPMNRARPLPSSGRVCQFRWANKKTPPSCGGIFQSDSNLDFL